MTSREQFDRQAGHYDQQWADWNRQSLDWLMAHSGAALHHRLLDVATGSGFTAQGFAPLVASVVGVDVSPAMLAAARAKGIGNARFEEAAAERLPFAGGSFDIVVSRIAPHHFASVPEFLREAFRVLVPGGRLLIGDTSVPDGAAEVAEWQNNVERLRDASHVRNYTPGEWRAMVAAAGFRVVHEGESAAQMGITLEDWMTKAGCVGQRAEEVRRLFREAPAEAVRAFGIRELPGGDFGFSWRRVMLVAVREPRELLRELGVRPIVNAAGSYTMFTGSLLHPDCLAAMADVARRFVRLDEFHDAIGRRIAALLGVEAAMVPSGAAAALTLGTAACVTGTNADFILRIPDLRGMKSEVIVQRAHRFPYDHMVRNCGVTMIEVETAAELRAALNERTAMMLYLNKADGLGRMGMEEWTAVAREAGVPSFNDAAADVPPLENLWRPIRAGFDLIAVSGGKAIRGPQNAGLLLGRADLIHAARQNTAPHSDTMGRSCKASKEAMAAMLVALERFLERDHAADYREWERRIAVIDAAVRGLPGVRTETFVPAIANQCPHLRVWCAGKAAAEIMHSLRAGEPSIETVPGPAEGSVEIASWCLEDGEAEIVAARLRAVLTS